jgi:hypothetical protein
MKSLLLPIVCILIPGFIAAQQWTGMMGAANVNFYEVQSAFNNYWKDKDIHQKGRGYKQFKRWEHFMEPRVYPSGDLWLPSTNLMNFEKFMAGRPSERSMAASSTWTLVGPMGAMTGSASNGFPRKAGRDNFITFHPNVAATYWVGAPSGGLWKTTDNGVTWSTNTDNLSVIGCSDLAIDPVTPSTMYLATGDGDSGDTYCIGVLKSTDGGATWSPTGLVFGVNQTREMRRLIVNPVNPQILIAATNSGIYRTTDAGATWSLVMTGNMYDAEFKPGNPNIIYAAGSTFYISTNGGSSFTQVTNGITNSGTNRMNIAVTTADTNYVYVLASSFVDSGLYGVFKSTDGGNTFITASNSPDILSNPCNGSGSGGQGWYDLAIAASPLDKDEVVVGGVNAWKSTDGGVTWNTIGCWIGTGTPPYVHADHHELEYNTSGILYSANDGGIFSYTGTSWTDRTGSRNIAQIYKIGLSTLSPNLWITGHQDNGSNIYTGTTYKASMAGDGMDCFIDRTNDNNMFASYYNGNFQRSTNGGLTWASANGTMTGSAPWVAPWKQDPVTSTRLYAGRSEIWTSNNLGQAWTQLTSIGGSGMIAEFAIAPSNNQVIYAIKGTSLRKTTNGGTSWTLINGTVPVGSAAPTFIVVDPNDANNLWVTLSGYSAGNKVFQSINGGSSWTNVSSNLPNLPANCAVYQNGSNDRIYIGMDVGVYYKDNSSSQWTLYNAGLPNVPISDLEISPASPTLLRAATYGRGVYEVETIQSTTSPSSNFAFATTVCEGAPTLLLDNSTESPTAWSWSVDPATGVNLSSTSVQNPSITFATTGIYTVSLIASNGFGAGSVSSKTINVSPKPQISFAAGSPTVCPGSPQQINVSGATTYTWLPGNVKTTSITVTTSVNVSYTVRATAAGCTNQAVYDVIVSDCTGLNDGASQGRISVYPNPTTHRITVKNSTGTFMEVELKLFDVAGKLIQNSLVDFTKGDSHELSVEMLPAGVYHLSVQHRGTEIQVIKLVKE